MDVKNYENEIDKISKNKKLFRCIKPEKILILNSKGEKIVQNFLDCMFNDIVKEEIKNTEQKDI